MDNEPETHPAKPGRGRPKKPRPETLEGDREEQRKAHQRAIGDRIRKQRELRGWSPADLAHRCGLTGQGIRELEQGNRAPLTWTIFLLAQALECGAGWLAFGG